MLSMKSLGIRKDTVTVFPKTAAPPELQAIDLSNEGKLVWIVPTKLAGHVRVNSIYSQKIRGGIVYIS